MKHIDFSTEIKNLKKLLIQKKYFELICIGVQFIDYFSDKINEQIPLDKIPQDELNELENHTGIPPQEWKNLKKEISKSLKNKDAWKYKFLGILDDILNTNTMPYIEVTKGLITKVRKVHQFRNTLQHKYYKEKITIQKLETTAKECLEICELFRNFDENGFLDSY